MPARAFRAIFIPLIVCVFSLAAIGVFAQESSAGQDQAPDPITAMEQSLPLGEGAAQPVPAASAFSILRVILTLAVVAAAIYGIVFFIKKASRGSSAEDPFLKILASTPLGSNRGAYIISVGSKAWLVGAAENGVNLISEIEDQDILNAMLLENSRKSAEAPAGRLPNFRAMLRRLGMPVDSNAPGPDSIRRRSERLKGLK